MYFRLSRLQALAYAQPGIAIAWLVPPMYAILGDFYLRYTAATAAGVGTAMVLSKIVDAITDPPVGYLSDRTTSPWGARKPWILAGALLSIPMLWMFFNPPSTAGNLYFTAGIVLYYLTYTLVKIPYRAWLGEIAPGYSERSLVWSWFIIGTLVGGVGIMLLPLILSSPWLRLYPTAEFTPEMMAVVGAVGMVLLPVTLLLALWAVPQGRRNAGQAPELKQFFDVLFECKPLQRLLFGYSLSALGFGAFYSVIVVALTSYYGFADRVPLFMIFVILTQVISIPLWERAGRIFSKHGVWASAWLAHALLGLAFWLFDANTPFFWVFLLLSCLASALQGPHMLFPVSIVSDIVDYDSMKTYNSRSGNIFSVFTFVDKLVHALGFGLGYYLLAAFGYDAKLETNTELAVIGLKLAFIVVPSTLFIASALVLFGFPINARKHRAIRSKLEQRAHRLTRSG
jgi:Na+/melibiose symporter-like transporter